MARDTRDTELVTAWRDEVWSMAGRDEAPLTGDVTTAARHLGTAAGYWAVDIYHLDILDIVDI